MNPAVSASVASSPAGVNTLNGCDCVQSRCLGKTPQALLVLDDSLESGADTELEQQQFIAFGCILCQQAYSSCSHPSCTADLVESIAMSVAVVACAVNQTDNKAYKVCWQAFVSWRWGRTAKTGGAFKCCLLPVADHLAASHNSSTTGVTLSSTFDICCQIV